MTTQSSHPLLKSILMASNILLTSGLLLATPLHAATDAAPSVSVSFYRKLNEANDWLRHSYVLPDEALS